MSSPATPGDDTIETTQMTCGTAMKDYCATNTCDQTFAAAEQDKHLCPASEVACGQFNVVTQTATDATTNFFYQGGDLVAIEHVVLPSQHDCLAGPASFTAQHCTTGSRSLPACSTEPPPTGW
jgi:hypothetical protein